MPGIQGAWVGSALCRVLPIVVLAAVPARGQFGGSSTNFNDADCKGLKLAAASGVPAGDAHSYKFQGVCQLLEITHGTKTTFGFTTSSDSTSTTVASVWVVAGAKWYAQTGQFVEKLQVQGQYAGAIEMSLKCATDPVITNGACFAVAYSNTTGWDGFDGPYAVPRPITRGKTTLAEAAAFSSKPSDSTPPPAPPPPAPNPAKPTPKVLRMGSARAVGLAPVTIPLVAGARVALADGRALVARLVGRTLAWVLVGRRNETLRTFPPEAVAVREASGNVVVRFGRESVNLGP